VALDGLLENDFIKVAFTKNKWTKFTKISPAESQKNGLLKTSITLLRE
jgi:hypothetical protein